MSTPADGDQLALVAGPKARRSRARVKEPAALRPVAQVAVDVPLPHLDRLFDYVVPAHLDEQVAPGTTVRVRLAGRLVDGYVLDRVDRTDHEGRLAYVERAVAPEPLLSAEIAGLARAVADRQAGTLADVLRLAVPPRHAASEAGAPTAADAPSPPGPPDPRLWARYPTGTALLDALTRGDSPRAVWSALPGPTWPDELALAVVAALAGGRGAVVVVPDVRDTARVDAALHRLVGGAHHVVLTADLGPAERYRRFLTTRRGAVRAVVGTRAAVFAPVREVGLVAVWDDGDDSHVEPRAPYPHVREVAALRAHLAGAAFLLGGHTRTAEGQLLVESGWAHAVAAERPVVRAHAPLVEPTGDDAELARDAAAQSARLPTLAWRRAREALAVGTPVLVQVPRRGYVPSLVCARCHSRARCPHCAGPLSLASGHAVPTCRWCGRPAGGRTCPECGATAVRASVVGAARTAEELGRAFPGVPVRTSGGPSVLATLPAEPALVVATPGAEPVADGGYGAVLLLDTWALLTRADLRATEEALRRWFAAAALARPGPDGGRVVVVADRGAPAVQTLVRWDPARAAEGELADRASLGFPPVARLAELTGDPADIADLLQTVSLPASSVVLGPVPAPADDRAERPVERMLVRVPRSDAAQLAAALKTALGVRSARHSGGVVRVRLDPPHPV